ncbi:MAG: tRNA pseudouridine(13) synthase TruD [Deltaproteobacteria bacterium]|nr:tRNA pseudouridine(13) synthase TruD [Deltaproteobacteria bacterium]MBN2674463.1 tRNA pseudouridine(13) synthase TruD [Deltaproteobacteria bacterium]
MKCRPEDFIVEEIPLYEPCGEGDHVYFGVEKTQMTSNGAAVRIADALGVNPKQIGMAGQKDAQAVTRQTMSIEHMPSERISQLAIPGIRILWTKRHGNKLKMGHSLGNRFDIRLRETSGATIEDLRSLLAWLETQGVPNYFGAQRFGSRGDTWMVGRALLRNDFKEALTLVLGIPTPELEGDAITNARQLFENEDYAASAAAWPRGFGANAKLCRIFVQTEGHYKKTLMSVGKKALSFYVSAYQSELFNRVVSARIGEHALNRMYIGDLAWKHDKGVCFLVEDADAETIRAQAGEISPTGPLFGKKMKHPHGNAGAFEQSLLEAEHLTADMFSKAGPFRAPGGRRPLRIFPQNSAVTADADAFGEYCRLTFALPAGAYATVLLREMCKGNLVDATIQSATTSW